MSDRDIVAVVRAHAALPDSMLWAELGVKVPEARQLVAHVERRDIALTNGREEIERLRAELAEARTSHEVALDDLAVRQAILSRVERTSGQMRALNSALIVELNRACNDLAAARAEIESLRSQTTHPTDEDSPPNPGAGPRKEPT